MSVITNGRGPIPTYVLVEFLEQLVVREPNKEITLTITDLKVMEISRPGRSTYNSPLVIESWHDELRREFRFRLSLPKPPQVHVTAYLVPEADK